MATEATVLTTRSLTSTPTTRIPRLAMTAAVGNPIYPSPTTTTFWNSGISHNLHNSSTRMAVSERIMCTRHFQIMLRVVEQRKCLRNNPIAVRSHQTRRAGEHAFRPLRSVAHDQDRLSEGRRFLLDTARIGQNNMRKRQQANKVGVFLRGDHFGARGPGQTRLQNVPNIP